VLSTLVAAVLVVAVLFAGWLWYCERRRAEALSQLCIALAGHADAARAPFELLQQAGRRRVELARGGDNRPGTFDNPGQCPCRHTYTCATKTIVLNAWPNPNPNPVRGFPWNAPAREAEPWSCPGNCVVVCTRVWRGWVVVRLANGAILMHIHTYAQYHCKEPGDPDVNRAPAGEALPPEPEAGDVQP
jgi:hypothetical protein